MSYMALEVAPFCTRVLAPFYLRVSIEKTLGQKMVLPERQIHQVEAFFHRFPTAQTLFIDGSERPTQRAQDSTEQKSYYSGKKNDTPVNTFSSAMTNGVF